MRALSAFCVAAGLIAGPVGLSVARAEDHVPDADGRYLVKFRDVQGAASAVTAVSSRVTRELPRQHVLAMRLSEQEVRILRGNPNVEYVEVDQRRYPLAQTKPYGISMVQADHADLNTGNASVGATVCVIDSGYYQDHEDLQEANVTGTSDSGTGDWFDDSCGHGTHVAGTVAALDNALGVVGVNGNGLLQIHVEKVFNGASCGWAYSSDLIAALNRCQDAVAGTNQKLVVNMSLGGPGSSAAEEQAFQAAYDSGVLPIAAAGNGGSTATSYPAGYASVISVAAVDSAGIAASFSQRNGDVELAAPGVAVVSTTPFNISRLVSGDNTWLGSSLIGAARTDAVGVLADGGLCDVAGPWAGQVVLCERGGITFWQKVANVAAGGGVGTAIYNNVAGGFTGTLSGESSIPAVSLSRVDGQAALAKVGSESSLVNSGGVGNGYEPYNGTSMATPHVAGVAALVWSHYPEKSNGEIREALQRSALDKGVAGKDNTYGYGIVQAKGAYDYLAGVLPPPPPASNINLTVTKVKSGGKRYARLRWSGATGSSVHYYRNATRFKTANDGTQRDGPLALGTYTYRVCNLDTTTCSAGVTITY